MNLSSSDYFIPFIRVTGSSMTTVTSQRPVVPLRRSENACGLHPVSGPGRKSSKDLKHFRMPSVTRQETQCTSLVSRLVMTQGLLPIRDQSCVLCIVFFAAHYQAFLCA